MTEHLTLYTYDEDKVEFDFPYQKITVINGYPPMSEDDDPTPPPDEPPTPDEPIEQDTFNMKFYSVNLKNKTSYYTDVFKVNKTVGLTTIKLSSSYVLYDQQNGCYYQVTAGGASTTNPVTNNFYTFSFVTDRHKYDDEYNVMSEFEINSSLDNLKSITQLTDTNPSYKKLTMIESSDINNNISEIWTREKPTTGLPTITYDIESDTMSFYNNFNGSNHDYYSTMNISNNRDRHGVPCSEMIFKSTENDINILVWINQNCYPKIINATQIISGLPTQQQQE